MTSWLFRVFVAGVVMEVWQVMYVHRGVRLKKVRRAWSIKTFYMGNTVPVDEHRIVQEN